jgi:hypothetical protein
MNSPAHLHRSGSCSGVPLRFPFQLHQLLREAERTGFQHIISWSPCGTMFKVHDPDAFAKFIMPNCFRHSRYKSFLRQLSMYKFQRVTNGPSRGAYSHTFFRRCRLDMCRGILRGEKYIVKQKDKTSEEDKVKPKRGSMSFDHFSSDLSSEDEDSSELTMNDFYREKAGASLGDKLKAKCTLPCPLVVDTPEDILDEIISTFGSKRSEPPEACEVAGRCA